MDPSGAFSRSSSNVSLSSLVRSGSGRGGANGGSRRMFSRILRGVITFIFAIGTPISLHPPISPFTSSLLESPHFLPSFLLLSVDLGLRV